ncbi:hypothetical protein SAMN05421882_101841 [Nitrosomonas communis]|uniref:Uncharacterized protein n=1 Tax=Nitrosomonas communis TaxID=44574 RepID=A0A1H2UX66_9PROT|nr:hypothetical protein SAMN05421882_101841 [Nitrosomonas communis]
MYDITLFDQIQCHNNEVKNQRVNAYLKLHFH